MTTEIKTYEFSPRVYAIVRVLITRPLQWTYHMELIGGENWPRQGPAIFASNHASNMDPPLVCLSYFGHIRWMAKIELLKAPVLGWLLMKLGAFPVRRGESDREAIRRARELLEQGYIVGMFPEGTRQRNGMLGEPQPGVGLLAMTPGVPVFPIRIRGDEKIVSNGRPHRPKVTVTVGPPIDLDITGMSKGKAYREASRRIMAAIDAL
ncbi:MAG: 1-acyl-sn-glycerol-3-phosphate acyltransferase [Actinobacteria bacterium]|nr:1-acyl-sn-glycerol-3-phosphate acyltransferase [Actinomycetota bacterium]MCL5882686.1 1-acyl-sn-glycerol-3-phosphate acyltransferase [Actinomycetota bacterium]